MAIRSPIAWTRDHLALAAEAAGSPGRLGEVGEKLPAIRRIGAADLRDALARGYDDFGHYRTDIVFLCLIYPVVGLMLGGLAAGYDMLPLVFPLASGFALVGPIAAVGLYEISRLREEGVSVTWAHAFDVAHRPAFGAIAALSVVLIAVFLLWLAAAWGIYALTLGPEPPASIGAFVGDVFTTGAGWLMIVIGIGVGFLFAVVALAISVVSFPLLVDHHVGVMTAVVTSVRVVAANPMTMATWGGIVAGALVIGSLPLFVGLAVALPVLGHATWHLYRKAVVS